MCSGKSGRKVEVELKKKAKHTDFKEAKNKVV